MTNPDFTPSVHTMKLEISRLNAELAKANERVEELEGQLHLTILTTHEASFESDYGKKRLNKFAIEKKIEAFEKANIPRRAKAGCIGEFEFVIKDATCCPECWQEQNDDCHMCDGKSDESGLSDLTAAVPWDLCKEIWLRMNKIYAEQLRKEQE